MTFGAFAMAVAIAGATPTAENACRPEWSSSAVATQIVAPDGTGSPVSRRDGPDGARWTRRGARVEIVGSMVGRIRTRGVEDGEPLLGPKVQNDARLLNSATVILYRPPLR